MTHDARNGMPACPAVRARVVCATRSATGPPCADVSPHEAGLALMRFYLDEHLSDQVARIARNLGVDVITVHEWQTDGEPDEVQLTYATERSRCIVTRDRDDFTVLATTWAERVQDHTGILIVSRSLPGGNPAAIAPAAEDYRGYGMVCGPLRRGVARVS